MASQKQILENFKKVCICRSITGGTILKAMKDGHLTFESLRRKINVGTGNCNAKRCREKIEAKLRDYKASLPENQTNDNPPVAKKIN